MELIKLLSNPVKIRVMQQLQISGEATTKQIKEALHDVPAPTLYRHIETLLKEEILLVKEERKVRGSLERLLTINHDKLSEATNKSLADTAYHFLMELYSRFQRYSCIPDADPLKDKLCLRTVSLSLTDEQFDDFMREVGSVIAKYTQNEAEGEGKKRSISVISAPVGEESQ
jgi:DNA-binding transcriptional ArsR family regulator